ncbi:carboxymuconolactone decarboxylase family protein [Candidatus Lokiarchaeum ossiferum]|uniref:carboxymuconolactone decarboxylase family protein n=1 Tax=Candidatus Lokiarchaeum ossiferum TaxID=2951803 RepID=UPI00352BF894
MRSTKILYDEAKHTFNQLNAFNPKAIKGFTQYIHSAEKDGALSAKIKQIIMVSVSVAQQCEWCIVYHTRKALDYGATRDELLEACMVTGLMGGGPSMMYSGIVISTIEDFQKENEKIN